MEEYQLKTGKIGNKVVATYKTVEKKFTDTFLEKDENSVGGYRMKTGKTAEKVTNAYHKIEDGVVGAYQKIEDAFVDTFLEKKNEEESSEKK
ncbi:hypothetical protein [Anaerosporobacter sp.]